MIAGNFYPQKANIKKKIKACFPIATLLVCSLLLLQTPAQSQTYFNVTNLSGTSTVGGVNVTVTSAGVVSSFACAGLSQPYLEGQDLMTSSFGVGSYTWSFSVPVSAVRIHFESIDIGDDVSITINGLSYNITSANISPLITTSTCLGSTGTAVALAGNLVNSGVGTESATLDIVPGFGINTITVQSLGAGVGVINDFTFAQNSTPVFVNGNIELFSICESSAAFNLGSLLAVIDSDMGQTLTWSISTPPIHGTTGGFPGSATSTGDTVIPTGLTYTPTPGFSGFDTLDVQVTDGITSAAIRLVVTVKPKPTLSSSLTMPDICSGSLASYTPTSPVAGTVFTWNRPFVGGISNPSASGVGDPFEVLYNITYYNVSITYVYTLVADGCSNTQSVALLIKPIPGLTSKRTDTICNGDTLNYIPTSSTAGATFAWSRASVPGISPATSSGSGNIHEQLINTTAAPVNTVYHFGLNAGGCTSTDSLTVTVSPPITGLPITTMPPSSLCEGTVYQNFGTSTVPGIGVIYSWSAVNATVMATGNNSQYSLVSFNDPGTAVVTLGSSIPGSPCLTTSSYSVTVSAGENPSATIIYYNYQFIYLDNTPTTYQWGYDEANTLDSVIAAGQQFQSYPISSPDFAGKYYWVMTTKNGCMQKTYYNAPVAIANVEDKKIVKLYPNPASNTVTIEIDATQGNITDVSLINMLGQTIKTIPVTGHKMQLDIASLPTGVYLVSCNQNGIKIAASRFIKN